MPSPAAQDRDWENPAVFERGQTAPHASWIPYATVDQAVAGVAEDSPYRLSLNGTWKFLWAAVPEESPADFYREGFPDRHWDPIQVPLPWQMAGFGYPMFRNIAQPFKADPPHVPSDFNPVGCYRRLFVLPEGWEGREVLLRFEGVHSASWVYLNGQEVGYNEGGMEPAEYNVTRFLKAGENLLAVRVLRFSDGSYLEDQDMWRLSGIIRDVWLSAVPRVHIGDFSIVTDLDESYRNAKLTVGLDLANLGSAPAEREVRLSLREFAGPGRPAEVLWTGSTGIVPVKAGRNAQTEITTEFKDIRTWSAEHPNLYLLTMELLGEGVDPSEVLRARVGFREVEIRDQQVLINGMPVKFNGVNSHMQDPDTGRTVSVEAARHDLVLMKQYNVNLVRTSHYPPPAHYLDLADELGMYIIDETGDEAHATENLSEDPAWRNAYLDRGRQMVLRDRNHPSVIIWSAGNESGSGDNICAVIEEGLRLDPTRPGWMYGGNNDYTGDDPKAFNPTRCETIVGPRYPTPRVLEERVAKEPATKDPRPSFMDEYLAASGNALGGLDEYWDLIWRYPRLTGGAVWDWASPGLRAPVRLTPDNSSRHNFAVLNGRPELVLGRFGNAVSLSGHDDFMELYRDPALDLAGSGMTIEAWVYPRRWNGHGWLVNKGEEGYGLIQSDASTLLFYVGPQEGARVSCAIPSGWEYRWHRLVGTFDGKQLRLYVDGDCLATQSWSGSIGWSRFPLNLGRKADLIGQEHAGYLSNAVLDRVRVYDFALIDSGMTDSDRFAERALLDLEFDSVVEKGSYFTLGIGARSYGLVWPDRRPQPELEQLKKSAQPVKIEALDLAKLQFRITNRFAFTDLDEVKLQWTVYSDGQPEVSGPISLALEPGKSADVRLFTPPAEGGQGADRSMVIQALLAEDRPWAAKGHELAWEQFPLPYEPRVQSKSKGGKPGFEVAAAEADEGLVVEGSGFAYRFDRATGKLFSLRFHERELLVFGPEPDLFRAPVANEFERSWGEPRMEEEWVKFGLDRLSAEVTSFRWERPNEFEVVVTVESLLTSPSPGTRFRSRFQYRINGQGVVRILHRVEPEGPMPTWLPKVGTRLTADRSLSRLTWFGRGPFETYPDRKTGAKVGLYSAGVKDLYEPYLIPQDYGNRTDVRWAALTSDDGSIGLFVSGGEWLNVAVRNYETDRLYRAEYPFQLAEGAGTEVSLDAAVTGVGCTAIKTLEPYRVLPRVYEYELLMVPFSPLVQAPAELYVAQ